MYAKLFKVLRENPKGLITAPLLTEMGMKPGIDQPDCWIGENFLSGFIFLDIKYDEPIIDIVEIIIDLDVSSYCEDLAEQAAGEDW